MSTLISNFDTYSFVAGVVFMLILDFLVVTWALCSMNAINDSCKVKRVIEEKEEIES